jgi:glutamine cyclotransferase
MIMSGILFLPTGATAAASDLMHTGSERAAESRGKTPTIYSFKIIRTYPHDPRAFTQGLIYENGFLYEGTGLYQRSSLRKVELETGEVLKSMKLPAQLFGEGITLYKERLIQLTWRSHIGFVYDRNSFKLIRTFQYPSEGWGITHDGTRLIMSDGTERLYFLDAESYHETGRIHVHDDSGFVKKLNELEYVKGKIFANVWQTSRIAVIDPATGQVVIWIELGELVRLAGGNDTGRTLNGIAYDADGERLFVTGKLWSRIYEISLVPPTD